jgi:hypothetical protein
MGTAFLPVHIARPWKDTGDSRTHRARRIAEPDFCRLLSDRETVTEDLTAIHNEAHGITTPTGTTTDTGLEYTRLC